MDKAAEKRRHALAALSERPAAALLREPIEYIFADHFRQRMLCGVLDGLATAKRPDSELAARALEFLRGDFSLHVLDEEEDLFPLLRRRAAPDDDIAPVLGELSAEHAADKRDAEAIAETLTADTPPIKDWRVLFSRFAANERHHLIVENAIVLPLARVRLTAGDRSSLGRRMAARRGVEYPEGEDAQRPT